MSGNGKTAEAAVAPNSVSYTDVSYGQKTTNGDGNAPTVNLGTLASGTSAINTAYGEVKRSNNVVTITKKNTSSATYWVGGYICVKASIVVPAYTKYTVNFNFALALQRYCTGTGSGIQARFYVFNYGTSDQSSSINIVGNAPSPATTSIGNLSLGTGAVTQNTSGSATCTQTYDNTSSGSAHTLELYFGFWANLQYTTSNWSTGFTATATMSNTVTVATTSLSVNRTTAQYAAGGNNFNFTYNHNQVVLSSVDFTDLDGVTSTYYSGSGTSPIDSAGDCNLVNCGTYVFTFNIASACGAVWSGTNQSPQTKTITITPIALTVPSITLTHDYNGGDQQYVMTGFDSAKMKVDSVVGANGNTVNALGGGAVTPTTSAFEAKNADNYTVALSLSDPKNYCWNDAAKTRAAKKLNFEMKQKELNFSFACSETGAAWDYGTSGVTITVTEDSFAADNVSLVFYYDTTATALAGTLNGKDTELAMPTDIANGAHTLYAIFNGTAGDNANYKITSGNTFAFTVNSGSIDLSRIKWTYTVDGAAGGNIADGDELEFKLTAGSATVGVQYELSVDLPSDLNFITVGSYGGDRTKSTVTPNDGSTYTASVLLTSTDPSKEFNVGGTKSSTCNLQINWKIIKGTFDLSGVKWEYYYTDSQGQRQTKDYTGAIEYDDINYALKVKADTLPAGLTLKPEYTFSDRQRDVDTYTASATKGDFNWNTSNFNAPDETAATLTLSWEIKQKNLYTNFKYEKVTFTQTDGTVVSFYNKVLDIDDKYKNFVLYEYRDSSNNIVTLNDIGEGVDMTSPKSYTVKAYIDPAALGAANFVISDGGSDAIETVTTGSNNSPAFAKIDGILVDGETVKTIITVYDRQPHFTQIAVESDTGVTLSDFTVTYYKEASLTAEKFADGEYPTDAGEYMIEILLGSSVSDDYILLSDVVKVSIKQQGIALPELAEIPFSGEYVNLADYLGGSYTEYSDIITLGGDYKDIRNVSQNGYTATLTIEDKNYCWTYPAPLSTVKFKKTDFEIVPVSDTVASYVWNIVPLKIDASNMWNRGSMGATLNLPESVNKLITAETLSLGYRYYDDAGNFIETPELKGGRSFRVEAVLGGIDAEQGNVVFTSSDGSISGVSERISYTVPQSGAAAVFGKAVSFFKANWWWLVIALAVLLFLIILICIIRHRKKTKEERLAKKEAKEEEKRRKEEEREAEKRRREQELELEKAKQEAELAKMRAQAGMAGAGVAAMGAMAMAQQPQPQAQMPQYPQTPYQAPAQAQPPMPQQPYPQMQQGYDGGMMAMMQAQLMQLRAEQSAAMNTQMEILKLRMDQNNAGGSGGRAESARSSMADTDVEKVAALATAIWRNMNSLPKSDIKEIAAPEESKPLSVSYPPDAVVTTTTRVDTTKNKQVTPRSDDGRMFDVDGFYDTFDEK